MFTAPASAGTIPQFLPVQGHLVDTQGQPLTGTHQLLLMLFDSEAGTQPLHAETHSAVEFRNGQFYAPFGAGGDANPDSGTGVTLDLSIFFTHTDYWLEIQVDGGTPIQPRLKLGSVPYLGFSMNCTDAQTLSGKAASDFALASHSLSWGSVTGIPADIADGDGDRLGTMNCAAGTVPKYTDNNVWECQAVQVAPQKMIVFFDGAACPAGWAEWTPGQGRAVVATNPGGTVLAQVGTNPLKDKQDPAHTHKYSAAATTSTSAGSHSHPFTSTANITLASVADHTHQVDPSNDNVSIGMNWDNTFSDIGHSHILSANGTHTHTVSLSSTLSTTGTSHVHVITYAANLDTAGAAPGAVMPYVQLRPCVKQ
jgi:hypothetical protein